MPSIHTLLPCLVLPRTQDLAIRQLVDAVCAHVENLQPRKPLVLSMHGPPGVGKTFTTTLLARALYNL